MLFRLSGFRKLGAAVCMEFRNKSRVGRGVIAGDGSGGDDGDGDGGAADTGWSFSTFGTHLLPGEFGTQPLHVRDTEPARLGHRTCPS
ncbi:hypothetical protein Tsubulata_044109 [Turnera subulata]|uniref:Uncharacterized protein n=1 Tax=Turnera subulata TaxID=218843 RepID=A0A9Q0FCT5_9ROSI|nr:hypothetical protein Tsubulata_044109 [Turnera subulata]